MHGFGKFKKTFLIIIFIQSLFVLTACKDNYFNEIWNLDSEEKSLKYLPKYKEYTLNTIDEYNIEYILTEIHESNYIKLLFIFEYR